MKKLTCLSSVVVIASFSLPVIAQVTQPTNTLLLPVTAQPLPLKAEELPADPDAMPLKAGDRIRITVAGFPDLSGDQVILADGTIQLPMAGKIAVKGLAPSQTVALLTESLKPYVRRPHVGLSLLAASPMRISVTGEVLRPGPQLLSPRETQAANGGANAEQGMSPITLSDALILAGGIKPSADLKNITIRRPVTRSLIASSRIKGINQPLGDGGKLEISVNLWQAIQGGDLASNPRIYDGDEIIIAETKVAGAEQQTLLTSTIAPTRIVVQVAGEVVRGGQIEIAPTAGVSEAVAAAGGPTDKAKLQEIELYRTAPDGKVERQVVAFGKPSGPLRNGDLILVKKTGGSKVLDFLGRLLPPLSPLFYIFR
jgi:polysaccharide export outer membrane protein